MISVVVCSRDKQRADAADRHWREVLKEEAGEVVHAVGASSIAAGYNAGLKASSGEIVVFVHDDVEVLSPDFVMRLKGHLATCDVVGVGGTSRLVGASWVDAGPPFLFGQVLHRLRGALVLTVYGAGKRLAVGMEAMDGLFLAFRREVIEQVMWDAATFTGFHFYDLDVTYRAFAAGYRVAVASDLHVLHESGGSYGGSWQEQSRRFLEKFPGLRRGGSAAGGRLFTEVVVPSKEAALELMERRVALGD